jgi:Ca2+ transporting ATPase
MAGLAENLRTSFEHGLTPVDFDKRNEHFGSNKKQPSKRTPFCTLFFGALDDFMLKLLLVCAVVSISIEVGFAEESDRSHGKLI